MDFQDRSSSRIATDKVALWLKQTAEEHFRVKVTVKSRGRILDADDFVRLAKRIKEWWRRHIKIPGDLLEQLHLAIYGRLQDAFAYAPRTADEEPTQEFINHIYFIQVLMDVHDILTYPSLDQKFNGVRREDSEWACVVHMFQPYGRSFLRDWGLQRRA
ncbi:hypothetical protein ASPACDRAFT_39126 [Aspergillus aculeatus ATCC 16872]|uniref:DUF6604 domain-containing protein n=1 Tax=Aspergillus aculeatus (strain ATCC 16872 / CBS 172.66 / WB 5094) TaxID=690307 RepID=A0A1L9X5A3_ASPA1|nr:uncharacterized protein ASPACDRAFT_39126 [Aspergillus aculeatus ATCC 16872]OJK03509.1 hypothetical protein ASPACDRAFT_39126 [Aspergillus aculeatus ATCC 16872]